MVGEDLGLMSLFGTGALALSGVALAVGTSILYQPRWLIRMLARRSPDVTYFFETTEPLVALTIDDGPDPQTTPNILRTLARHNARATFFLIGGKVGGCESMVRELVDAGHEIGNHMTRDERSIALSDSEFERSLLDTHAILSQFAKLRWIRPAAGWYKRSMLSTIERHGYRCALGSVYPYDVQIRSVRYAVWHILRNARPGAVIVLHDGGDRGRRTVDALSRILPTLDRRGFRVVTLSELADASVTAS